MVQGIFTLFILVLSYFLERLSSLGFRLFHVVLLQPCCPVLNLSGICFYSIFVTIAPTFPFTLVLVGFIL